MGERQEAEDAAQEAFIRVFFSLGSLKDPGAFSAWLARTVSRVCLNRIQRDHDRKTVSLDHLAAEGGSEPIALEPTPEEEAESAEVRRAVRDAVLSLSPEYRAAITLRDLQGFSYAEITEMLEVPEGTVKSRIHEGRRLLREKLRRLGGTRC